MPPAQIPPTPFLDLTGPLRLPRDRRRRLAAAAARLADDGVREVIRFHARTPALAALRPAITAAWRARNDETGRPCDDTGWDALWARAGEAGTLHLDGHLAAWLLAAPARPAYVVLAGQMAPGWREYCPGRMLEEAAARRARELGYHLLDWGSSDHAGALLAVTRPA